MYLGPTWRNDGEGFNCISKRLDRFFLLEDLFSTVHRYHAWPVPSFFSNHLPIILQLESEKEKNHYPFKFNHVWLASELHERLG